MPLDPMFPASTAVKDDVFVTGPAAKLCKLTDALIDLISRETKLLKTHKPSEAQKLHGEKSRLMAEYRETLNTLRVNEHLLGEKDSKIRKRIREHTDQLRETLRDHARIVLRLKSVTEGLIKSVGEEVARKNQPVRGYGKNAAFQRSGYNMPTSLSVNRMI